MEASITRERPRCREKPREWSRRAGRLDDHPAARPQSLHRKRALPRAEDQRGLPCSEGREGSHEGLDSGELSEPGLFREPRLRSRGSGADVLLEACEGPRPRGSGAHRRHAPGAFPVRPLPAPQRGRAQAQRGSRRDAFRPLHRPGPARRSRRQSARADAWTHLYEDPRALLLQLRAGGADREVRCEQRPWQRPQGLHDDCPALPEAGRARNQADALLPERSRGGNRFHQSQERRDPRYDRGDTGQEAHAVQPGRAGPAASRLLLQAVCAHRGDPGGHQPGFDDVSLGAVPLAARSLQRAVGRLDLRRRLLRAFHDHAGDAALGQHGVLELAVAYATIAARGVRAEPMAIRKVVLPNGKIDAGAGWGHPERKRVLSDGVAYQVARILKMNIQSGTGTGANPGFVAGGKTGTTEDWGGAWFAGITTTASTVVWVGYPNAKIPMTAVHGIRVVGGTFPATIWRLFMVPAFGQHPPRDWPLPRNPVVWIPFHGQYQYFGAPPGSGDKKKKKKKDKDDGPPATTTAPPSATTEPPPTTTG